MISILEKIRYKLFGLNRIEMAILLVLYENDPTPMTEEQIMSVIAERGLLDMTNAEFKAYHKSVVDRKDIKEDISHE